jgi:hypothetical protein
MTRSYWRDFLPSLVLASSIVAGQSAQTLWSDFAGTCVLALGLLAADALARRSRGAPLRPSPAAWILAAAFVFAGGLALLRAPGHTGALIPLLGLGAWTAFFMDSGSNRSTCRIGYERIERSRR